MQNEEFLNSLKTDNDFIRALNDEILNNQENNKSYSTDLDYKPHQDYDYSYGTGKLIHFKYLFFFFFQVFYFLFKINSIAL